MNKVLYFAIPVIYTLSTISCQAPAKEELKPNVILIISDDQGWADYGFMGHEHIETPNLDALADESLCFTRGYATAPLCSPSLATLITGLYAHQHGITGNDPTFEFEGNRYSKEWMTARKPFYDTLKSRFYSNKLLTEYLQEAGYRSLQTGKWWLGSWKEGHFDHGMTHGDPERGGRHGDDGLKVGREGHDIVYNFIEETRSSNQPYFIWYAPFLPHTPHNPPLDLLSKYLGKTDSEPVAKYWAMCEWFDQVCGELVDYVRMSEEERETMIIYTTDNGWIQRPDRNGYAERSKRSPYEMGIRTPLMISWPGRVQPKLDNTTLASNIDIVPTILDAAGINSIELPGTNLLAETQAAQNRTVYAEAFAHDIADVHMPEKSLQYRIAVQFPWKLIVPESSNLPDANIELYNIQEDPYEKIDLSTENVEVVQQLKLELDHWWAGPQSEL